MKCTCNGNLKRIAVDCYQCKRCGLKHKIAFAAIPLRVNINPVINAGICTTYNSADYIKAITEDICKALMVPSSILHG